MNLVAEPAQGLYGGATPAFVSPCAVSYLIETRYRRLVPIGKFAHGPVVSSTGFGLIARLRHLKLSSEHHTVEQGG